MGRASASTVVPGRPAEAEALWYDRHRWPAWVDGFGHIVRLEGAWPDVGARLVWQSPAKGRALVQERVVSYEPRMGQTVEVEDERLLGTRTVAFEPLGDQVRVTAALEYELKQTGPLTPVLDAAFVRRGLRESLRRTLVRFGHERRAELG